jgi:hypothetical protein
MFLTQSELGQALTKNAKVAFTAGTKMGPTGGRSLYNVKMVEDLIVESDSYSYDNIARNTGEGNDYFTSTPVKGFKLIHTQGKYTDSFETTKEMMKYDKYSLTGVMAGIQGLGTSSAKRLELNLQLGIGMGAGASYVDIDGNTVSTLGADGQNAFSATKTTKAGVAYSNLQAIAFGLAGLEAHQILFRKMVNHAGQQINQVPTHIFRTRDQTLANTVEEYLNSRGNVGSTSNGINVYGYKGARFQVIEMEFLDALPTGAIDTSKKNYWGLAKVGGDELQCMISQNPVVYAPQLNIRNRNLITQTDMHFSHGIRDGFDATLSNA